MIFNDIGFTRFRIFFSAFSYILVGDFFFSRGHNGECGFFSDAVRDILKIGSDSA